MQGEIKRWPLAGYSISSLSAGEGPLVLCLHGFPDNARSFRFQVPALVEAGFRVECPWLPGYEPASQNRRGRYDLERVSNLLMTLIDAMAPGDQPVHLVGHDWGALISYVLAARWPTRFTSLTALTIPYNLTLPRILLQAPAYLRSSWYIQLFQLPGLAEHLLARDQWSLVEGLIRRWSPGWQMDPKVLDDIKDTLAAPGVREAALAYYRAIYGTWPGARHARGWLDGRIEVPCLMVEGQDDGCIHRSLWPLVKPASFPAGLRHARIGGGHFLHQERPELFNPVLLDWLNGGYARSANSASESLTKSDEVTIPTSRPSSSTGRQP